MGRFLIRFFIAMVALAAGQFVARADDAPKHGCLVNHIETARALNEHRRSLLRGLVRAGGHFEG